MAFDAKSAAAEIVRLVGGKENINSVAHCMTRLRFVVKDLKKADQEALKKVPGVLGVIYAGGQLMVVLGKNLLPVYETVVKDFDLLEGAAVNENLDAPAEKKPLTLKSAGVAVLEYVSAAVAPMITGLVAGGMLKVVLLLITLVNAGFADTATYALLSGLADAPFFFMPIFAAYGAAKKLGGTPIYSMMCAAALLHGKYTALVAAGEPITLLGLPVRLMSYSSSLLPALLVGLCTVTVTMVLGFTILAPLGGYLGNYLAVVFGFLGDKIGFITVGLLAACLPWLVMCGMHLGLVPFMTQALTNPGYDAVFRPAFILHNMAEGGACIGVALRTKDAEKRAEALSIAFGCIVAGVTEPAIYGINLPRKKPMYGVMAGGAVGGVVAGLLGAKAYVMGYSTVLALPIFQNTIVAMSIAIVTAIVVAAVVTYVLGFEEKN